MSASNQKVIMRGGLGLRLDCLQKDHVEWLQEKLTITSRGYQDNEGQTVRAFHIADGYLWAPRFFDWMDFWPRIKPAGWQWVCPIIDYDLKSLFTLDPARRQPEAVEKIVAHLKEYSSGISVLPTGIGKTMLSLEVGRRLQTPICVLVHKGDMIDNWVEHCETHLGVPARDVAIIKESSYAEGKPVTICSIQTLLSRDFSDHFYAQFGFIAADECITGDALIETDLGQIPLAEIPSSGATQVLCYDERLAQWIFRKIVRWLPRGKKRTVTVATSAARVQCTADHLFLTQRGWLEAQALRSQDLIYAPVKGSTWITSFQQIMSVAEDPGPGVHVFDLEIEDHHNFVANGMLVHNCHHYGAAQWSKVVGRFPARYRLGISADPIRDDGLDPIIRWNFGKIAFGVYKRPSGQTPLVCLMRWTPEAPYEKGSYHDWKKIQTDDGPRWIMVSANAMKYAKVLAKDEKRNAWIVDKLIEARVKGRKVLVFAKLRSHVKTLHDEFVRRWFIFQDGLAERDRLPTRCALLWGGLKDRERHCAMTADMSFTTYGFSKEALNVPHKDTLVLATPAGDPLQTIGRLRDKGDEDRKPFLAIDAFEGNDYSFKKAMQRRQAYVELGIEVKRFAVNAS